MATSRIRLIPIPLNCRPGMIPTAIIFDMDGVIFDSEPLHTDAWQQVLETVGFQPDSDWFDRWIGIADRELAQYLADHTAADCSPQWLLQEKRRTYRAMAPEHLRLFPGVASRLVDIQHRGLPMGLCTSSSREDTTFILDLKGLTDAFGAIVTACDLTHPKPAPDAYLEAARRLGHPPARCVVLEDSPAGLASARRAGCFAVAITSSHPADHLAEADRTFPATAEAIDWFLAQVTG